MDGDSDSDSAAAMARAMGFSAFGGANNRPAKKRRFDDAVVAAPLPGPSGSARGDKRSTGTDAGAGERTAGSKGKSKGIAGDGGAPLGISSGGNAEDEAAEEQEDDDDDEGDSEGPEPEYLDTSRPSTSTLPPKPSHSGDVDLHLPVRPPGVSVAFDPNASGWMAPRNHPGGGAGRGGRGGHGSPRYGPNSSNSSAPWWTDYYDPSSNANPWERLEQARGLQSQGSWLSHGGG